jgi:predicted dehydrogenase
MGAMSNATASTTQPLRLLVTGLGGIAGCWLHPLSQRSDVQVVALCDLDGKRAEAREAEFRFGAATGSDLAALIDQTRPDVVVDLTIPDAHVQVATLALAKGCHVFAEKPMTATMDQARQVLAATQAAGKVHAVMQNRRWLPQIIRFRDLIKSGAIGQLTELHTDFFLCAHFPGFREKMDHVLLIDMVIHHFDMARFISGADPVAVNALEWNPRGSWFQHGASTLVCVEMSDGLRLTYRGNWVAEGHNTPWEAQWRAVGTRGSARWDGVEQVDSQTFAPWVQGKDMAAHAVVNAPAAPVLAHTGHAGCIDDMIAAVRDRRPAATRGSDNVLSQAMVHAAIRSADRQGARVTIAEVMGATQAAAAR